MTCPFCQNPKRSKWYFDGPVFVVADDAGRPNTLILFPHEHKPQSWLRERRNEVENLLLGIGNAEWGRPTTLKATFDWIVRTYPEHAHLQLAKE